MKNKEQWDLYDKNRCKLNKIVNRGDKLNDNEYHLVVQVWIKNSDNKYLISRRSKNKTYPLMWETTGGSSLVNEDSLKAALRETKEELGIDLISEKGKVIGSTLRYFKNCPDILDVWLFNQDINPKDIVLQKEEVCDYMFATKEEIEKLIKEDKFIKSYLTDTILEDTYEDRNV